MSHFKQLINDYNNDIIEQKQFTPSIPQQIINRIAIIEDESLSQSMTNIKSILAQFNDNNNKVDIETTINLIINTTNESRLAAQQERMQLINDSISSSTSIGNALEEMEISDEDVGMKFPYLHQLGIPINQFSISTLLKEIVGLQRSLPNNNIMQYTTFTNHVCNVASIRVAKNEESFMRINRGQTKWFDHLPSFVIGSKNDAINESEVAGWMIKRLATLHSDCFIKVCEELGYSISSKKWM